MRIEEWVQDFKFAARQCRRAPGFVTATALTLALGIAATTAIFSVVNGVLLRALPYPDPDRVVQVWQLDAHNLPMQFSDPNFDDVKNESRSFARLAEEATDNAASVSGDIVATRATVTYVTHDFFDVMGVPTLIGRTFAPEEERENGVPAAVLSYGFWQRVFGGDPNAIGKHLRLGERAFTVIGVMRPGLQFPAGTDIYISRELDGRLPSRMAHNWPVVGRLAPGVTLAAARRDVSALASVLAKKYGTSTLMAGVSIVPLREQLVGGTRPILLVLLAASLVLLAIACTNAANLMVARLTARKSELAIRLALGAGRGRLVRQCLAESLLIAVLGGAGGLTLAAIGTRLLLALDPGRLPRAGDVTLDGAVLAFALVVSIGTAVALALVSGWRATRGDLREVLSASERSMSGAGSAVGTRRVLVVAQVAMTLVLLVAAGLLARSFGTLLRVNPGFRTEQSVVLDLSVGADDSVAEIRRVNFYHELLGRLASLPGVTALGAINAIPLAAVGLSNGTFTELSSPNETVTMGNIEQLMLDHTRSGHAEFRLASGGYFAAMHIPLLEGRTFDDRDTPDAPHAAVISASLAAQRWPGQNPIGKWIEFGGMDGNLKPFTIVGVVGDVREAALDAAPKPTFYAYYLQRPVAAYRINIVLAGRVDPVAVQHIVREMRPDVPPRVRTIESIVATSVASQRFVLFLVGVFGIAALLLAALGLYSVISYLVVQRTREIGIRVALGAQRSDILGLVLRQGAGLALVGIAIGSVGAFVAGRLIAGLLYGVSPADPLAFGGVAAIVAIVALVACWLPARRASRIALVALALIGVRASGQESLARSVTIYRDAWGVPHVFGATDASTVFGFAYAQAEDNFPRIEANYIAALGRTAEVYGAASLSEDELTRAMDVPGLAVAEYRRLDAHTRAMCDAFAAGLNYWLARHPSVHPRLLGHMEPWYPLAFIRYNYYVNGFVRDPKIGVPFPFTPTNDSKGSNGWVIGPSKSATGHAMLFINPHLPYFGSGQVYEGHVHSDEGWEFTGYTRFGFPLPYVGHNADLGWVSTDNAANMDDGYAETFDDPAHPLAYKYGNGYRTATERTEAIRVATDSGVTVRRVRFLATHHGPIVATYLGKPVAARIARLAEDGWLGEWYAMTRARTLAELKAALAPRAMLFGNVMSADRAGNTFYLYNGAIPRRDPRFDWTKPVDGSDPATEWRGFYPIDSLPQLTNPATGWMENCNSSPFLLTTTGNPDSSAFPRIMIGEGTRENPRARASRRILTGAQTFTFDRWKAAAFDTHVITADSLIPLLLADARGVDPDPRIDSAAAVLAAWDHRATPTSVAMTIYSIWHHALRDQPDHIAALRIAIDSAEPWGDRTRLQRPDERDAQPGALPAFSDAAPSIPLPAVDGYDGAVFTAYTVPAAGQHRTYAVLGGTYVSVVEFGPTVHAMSVHVFGTSGHAGNAHYVDQATLYARGDMKPTWFTLAEVKEHAVARYHPGAERG